MHERRNDSGRNTTALMASVFVIVGGLLTCSFVALAFADEPTVPMTVVFVYLATVILLVWLGRERPRHRGTAVSIFQFVRGPKNRDAEIRYEPRRRRVPKTRSSASTSHRRLKASASSATTARPGSRPSAI